MKADQIKTDNSFLADKVALRAGMLPNKKQVKVLDCYAGTGRIWEQVVKKTGKNINVVSIDIDQKQDFVLLGDNEKWLAMMDLTGFDVIDLDAYGVPFKQLEILFDKKYKGLVFVTFIQSLYGGLPYDMLECLGYTKAMIEKCPSLFFKKGRDKFLGYLKTKGIELVQVREDGRKHYLAFSM